MWLANDAGVWICNVECGEGLQVWLSVLEEGTGIGWWRDEAAGVIKCRCGRGRVMWGYRSCIAGLETFIISLECS